MADAGVLYQVISDFTADNADMNPEKISAIDMGYVFENLVQRFSESYDEEARCTLHQPRHYLFDV